MRLALFLGRGAADTSRASDEIMPRASYMRQDGELNHKHNANYPDPHAEI
jgi:hypothetical protein